MNLAPDESITETLRALALYNPRLALMLVRGQPIEPRTYNIEIEFDETTQGQRIPDAHLGERLYQTVWIHDITYTVRCPGANEGSIAKAWADEHRRLNPYVDVDIRIQGTERYQLTNGLTPLENIATAGTSSERRWAKRGWTLGADQNMFVDAVLQRTLNADEVPYIIIMTLSVAELSGCNLQQIAWADAVCELKELGLYPTFGAANGNQQVR